MSQEPSVGRIVHYRLGERDVEQIHNRRAQGDPGNSHAVGDVVPLVVVRPWHQPGLYRPGVDVLNGVALVDGPDPLWILSVAEGADPGAWSWPPRTP